MHIQLELRLHRPEMDRSFGRGRQRGLHDGLLHFLDDVLGELIACPANSLKAILAAACANFMRPVADEVSIGGVCSVEFSATFPEIEPWAFGWTGHAKRAFRLAGVTQKAPPTFDAIKRPRPISRRRVDGVQG